MLSLSHTHKETSLVFFFHLTAISPCSQSKSHPIKAHAANGKAGQNTASVASAPAPESTVSDGLELDVALASLPSALPVAEAVAVSLALLSSSPSPVFVAGFPSQTSPSAVCAASNHRFAIS